MHVKRLLSLLLTALLAVTVLASCAGRSDFSKEAADALNNAQTIVHFSTDSQLTKALKDSLKDNVQPDDVRNAMAADKNLQALLTDGYQLNILAVQADDANAAAQAIAQNASGIVTGKKAEGKIAMVLADSGYYYAAILTYRDTSSSSGNDDGSDEEPPAPPEVTDITVEIPEGSVAGTLKVSDLSFTAKYSDGTTQPIAFSDLTYTCNPALTDDTFETAGTYTLTITYDGKTFTETIEVEGDPENSDTWEIDSNGTLHIPQGATTIGSAAFGQNPDVHKVDLTGTDITRIEDMAFSMSTSLETVILSDKIEYIGTDAFSACTNLKEVTINGTSDIQICENIFSSCTSLEKVTFAGNITSIPAQMFFGASSLVNVDLGNISTIGSAAFLNCTKLETVLGSNLTNIESTAFSGCSALKNIDLSHAESIKLKAFYNCGSLTQIDLSSIKTIDQQAFSMQAPMFGGPAPVITDVRFGENVSKISNAAFSNAFADNKVNIYYGDGSEEAAEKLQSIGFNPPYGTEVTWHSYADGDSVF